MFTHIQYDSCVNKFIMYLIFLLNRDEWIRFRANIYPTLIIYQRLLKFSLHLLRGNHKASIEQRWVRFLSNRFLSFSSATRYYQVRFLKFILFLSASPFILSTKRRSHFPCPAVKCYKQGFRQSQFSWETR